MVRVLLRPADGEVSISVPVEVGVKANMGITVEGEVEEDVGQTLNISPENLQRHRGLLT